MSEPDSPRSLHSTLRDLLGLLALPPLWSGQDAAGILATTCEVLEALLPIDVAYAITRWTVGESAVEVLRVGQQDATARLEELRPVLAASCGRGIGAVGVAICPPFGTVRTLHMPVGLYAERGNLLVGSCDPMFPDVTANVLLRVATSLVATGLETARAIQEREQANRAKDEFLAMLSHELRNPLAPIVTALRLMRVRSEGPVSREHAVIERQVEHVRRLVDDLLDVSRVTRGKVELRLEAVEIPHVISQAVEMATPMFEQRRHDLHMEVPVGGLVVQGDRSRLAQVVTNLLTNAARYTPPAGRIVVRAARVDHEVVIIVVDNGVGISEELLPRIFDPFVQGKTSIHRTENGLGIGLALVKNLVTLHGGTVEVASEGMGKGSAFTVRLPATTAVAEAEEALAPSCLSEVRERVLLVDDNIDAGELLAELLRASGHEVALAHDGAGALEMLDSFRPTVALLDLGLPDMDGYELAAEMGRRLGTAGPRLIALTGRGQAQDRARSAAAGFVEHLVKPISVERLLDAIAGRTPGR
ncbi:hybrid sensor histidine kinase/response regulator [Polyangium jinanense]|uniref:histidine kinase n=1 Tax=Polyangium jinanense TaxID=2829994 RepID=A0A9X3XG63_9BACT|nr:ATP-binding protein [Polyangium jinanense]MDC3958186.1 response regulator [Polyangium jinanense]MDC3988128.1 response regulator [Polyangium jinanense]